MNTKTTVLILSGSDTLKVNLPDSYEYPTQAAIKAFQRIGDDPDAPKINRKNAQVVVTTLWEGGLITFHLQFEAPVRSWVQSIDFYRILEDWIVPVDGSPVETY